MPDEQGDGSGPFMPRSPDPTVASAAAVAAATEVSRREIAALRELHDKDLSAFRELLDARLGGMDLDRARLWDRSEDIIKRFTAALTDFREEVAGRDQANRQLAEQRLADLDKAIKLAADELAKIPAVTEGERAKLDAETSRRLAAEREFVLGQIEIARAETARTADVSQERFTAIGGQFDSNALALTAALAAQEKAVAAQNDSNTLAIDKAVAALKEAIAANAAQTAAALASQADTISDVKDRVVRIESTDVGAASTRTDQRLNMGTVIAVVAVLITLATLVFYVTKK